LPTARPSSDSTVLPTITRASSRNATWTACGKSPAFTLEEAALDDVDLARLLEGVTHVFHLAAQAGVRKSWGQDFRVYTVNNVDSTQVLLEACVGRPLQKFVYASSSSVYGDAVALPMTEEAVPQPVSPYGVTKLAAEHLCHLYHSNYGVPAVSMRYFTVYGPRQRPDMGFHRFFRATMRGDPVVQYGNGRQTRDFTFVADAVSATVAAAARGTPGAVYNIGGGSRVELLETFELIRRITGRPLRIDQLDAQLGDMRDTVRGDVSCTRGPRVRANRVARAGTSSAVRVDDRGRPFLIDIDD
jgi:UDP-glucose 4-epimerase